MRKRNSVLIVFVLFISLFCSGVSAQQYVSFARPDSLTQQDVYLYYGNGSLVGLYNTSSTAIPIPNDTDGDFMFVIKPQYQTPWDAPAEALTSGLAFLETYWIQIGVAVFLIGLLYAGARR